MSAFNLECLGAACLTATGVNASGIRMPFILVPPFILTPFMSRAGQWRLIVRQFGDRRRNRKDRGATRRRKGGETSYRNTSTLRKETRVSAALCVLCGSFMVVLSVQQEAHSPNSGRPIFR